MDDLQPVRVVQAFADLDEQRHPHLKCHGPGTRFLIREELALEIRHNQVNEPGFGLAEAKNTARVGMVEPHRQTGFTSQPLHCRVVGDQFGSQHLHGHRVTRVQLAGLVDVGHPPLAQLLQDLVPAVDDLTLEGAGLIDRRPELPLDGRSDHGLGTFGPTAARRCRRRASDLD